MPYLATFAFSLLHALCTWLGKGFPVWTTQTYAYTVLCSFVTDSNVKQCLNLLPVKSSAKLPHISMGLQWKLYCHTHAAEFQQFKQHVENVTPLFFLLLQSRHQILFWLLWRRVRLSPSRYKILLKRKAVKKAALWLQSVSSLMPGPNGSNIWSMFQQCSRATLHLSIWSNKAYK